MNAHSRFMTQNIDLIDPRFNERFILSLHKLYDLLIIDDEMNILPITDNIKN